MALTLMAGPANAGKVALLLDRYLADIDREPVLIVPTGSDVERVERDLLTRCGALMGGSIGTFDDVFDRIASGNGGARPVAGDSQRALVLRRVVAGAKLDELGRSARFAGFADALGTAIAELEAGLLDPDELDGDLAELYRRYRAELDRLGLWDRDLRRRYAADRLAGDLAAWDGRPVYAYGFEDLSAAQWRLLEAFAGRVDVTVSLQYEPGGPSSPRSSARPPTWRASPAAGSRSCRPDTGTTRIPRWRTSSARSSRTSRPRRPKARARFASSKAPARAQRSSSSRTRSWSSSAAAPPPTRSSSSARRSTGCARRSSRHSARSASRTRSTPR